MPRATTMKEAMIQSARMACGCRGRHRRGTPAVIDDRKVAFVGNKKLRALEVHGPPCASRGGVGLALFYYLI